MIHADATAIPTPAAVPSPRPAGTAVMRTLVAKDLRAALVPVSIVAFIGAVQVIVHAVDFASSFDGAASGTWARAHEATQQAIRAASFVGCAVLPAWAAVELAFLESRPGNRSMLPALPPAPAQVVASKLLVLLACVVVLATSVSCAFWDGRWGNVEQLAASNMVLKEPSVFSARVLWSWPTCSAFALAGLGSRTIARNRATGFAIAVGVPFVAFGAAWTAGAGMPVSAGLAWCACAGLAWLARPGVAGATSRSAFLGLPQGGGSHDHGGGAARGALAALLGKDLRMVARHGSVTVALLFLAGTAAFALALPVFGEGVMRNFGIRDTDPLLRRLELALPVAMIAMAVMPAIAALVLAFADGRAAGQPLAGLPVGRGAVMASKVLVSVAVLAAFGAIALCIHALARTAGPVEGATWWLVGGGSWMFLLLCASGIPWCLALPAFVRDLRAAAVVAAIGLPAALLGLAVAMKWLVGSAYQLITVELLGIRQWPLWIDAGIGDCPPLLPAWFVVGTVAAALAVPVACGGSSAARVRRRAAVSVSVTAVITAVVAAVAFVLPQVPWDAVVARRSFAAAVADAEAHWSLDRLVEGVAARAGSVPPDPPGGLGTGASFPNATAARMLASLGHSAQRLAASCWNVEWTRTPELRQVAERDGVWNWAGTLGGPYEYALALRAARDPAAVERELRRITDDPSRPPAVRMAAAAWLGPANAAMTAAHTIAGPHSVTDGAFALVVLAYCDLHLRTVPVASIGGFVDENATATATASAGAGDPGDEWCSVRRSALDALRNLERRATATPGLSAGRLGLAPDGAIDLSVVARARDRILHGRSDLCDVLRALSNTAALQPLPEELSATTVEAACRCLLDPNP